METAEQTETSRFREAKSQKQKANPLQILKSKQ